MAFLLFFDSIVAKKGFFLNIPHIPVLLDEVIDIFKEIKSGYIVDCTVGYGGHSEAILKSNSNIKMICIDQDDEALEFSKKRLQPYSDRVVFKKGRFSTVTQELKEYDIQGVLADIGLSSLQLDKKDRGFSFTSPTLDMRMNPNSSLSAYEVVNRYSKKDLETIFKNYGEFKQYKKLTSLIQTQRVKKPFESSRELAEFISQNFGSSKLHPATLPFQAIRIEVNDELGELKRLLENIKDLNISKSLIAIISFHSLEDKIVKNIFKSWTENCICPKLASRCLCDRNHAKGKIITKKPIQPRKEEVDQNPRSRSSRLRIFKFF